MYSKKPFYFPIFFVFLFLMWSIETHADIIQKGIHDTVVKTMISKDSSLFGYIYKNGAQFFVHGNGKNYGPFESVVSETFQYTNDGSNFGYVATLSGKQVVAIDSYMYGPYDTVTEFKFATDKTKVFSFRYSKDKNNYININGKPFGPYEQIDKTVFSEDGINYGFTYKKGTKYYANINGEEFGESYDRVGDISIAKDGGKFGFAYSKLGKYYININKKEYGPYDAYKIGNLRMSADGKTYIFDCMKDGKVVLNISGKEYPRYASLGTFLTSLDYSSFIFTYTDLDKKIFLNYNDKIFGPYDSYEQVSLSENGGNYAFIYTKTLKFIDGSSSVEKYVHINGKEYKINSAELSKLTLLSSKDKMVYGYEYIYKNNLKSIFIDGKEYGPFYKIPIISYQNKKWGIGLTDKEGGDDYVYINGEKFGPFDEGELENIIFNSYDSGYIFNYKKNDKRYINISGKEYGPYDQLDAIKFSIDGGGFSYRYAIDDKWYVKMNDTVYGPYDRSDYLNYGSDGKSYNFRFEKNGKRYINLNGKEFGPYESFIDLKFSEKNPKSYGFVYKNSSIFSIVNGVQYGPYTSISDLALSENNWGFIFQFISNEKKYINYNGNVYGPCEDIKNMLLSSNGNSQSFSCLNSGKWTLLLNNLSKIDKERLDKKNTLSKSFAPKIRKVSKQKLEAIYVTVEKIKENYKNKKSDTYLQLVLFSEIIHEEILNR